ncbi:MAG TPA: wax ester/triacylglycerol synthase family O-acyltransferase [Acidimicrobiales bacterium]|nr:wax ester/triacylglycerol synthase family O-acyltransferase [Acidimicrobiales bacterium]
MRRLSGFDAAFLYFETPTTHLHVGQVCVFDPSTAPDGHSFEDVRQLLKDRIHLIPPFRRRLAQVPFGLHHPVWIEDPDFDLDYHLRRAALPSPGGPAELADFSADVMSRPLDRHRPPWEMHIVEGLEGGMVGAVSKVHHAAIDGVSGAEATAQLLDLAPERGHVPPADPPWEPEPLPSGPHLVRSAVADLAKQPLVAARAVGRTARSAGLLWWRNRRREGEPPPSAFSGPRTSLQTAVGRDRRVAFAEVSLDTVKQIKDTFGGTVNDVVLAICAGALRSLLAARGEHPDEALVAAVPVSLRGEEDRDIGGNRASGMLVSLATNLEDPVERLACIAAGSKAAKDQERILGAEDLADWAEIVAPPLAASLARLAARFRLAERYGPPFNVVISNFRGSPFPLYSVGARMLSAYPFGPVADGAPLNITVQSYVDKLCFGLSAGREAVPEIWDIPEYLDDALTELSKAANQRSS